jgi:hypothetical protein
MGYHFEDNPLTDSVNINRQFYAHFYKTRGSDKFKEHNGSWVHFIVHQALASNLASKEYKFHFVLLHPFWNPNHLNRHNTHIEEALIADYPGKTIFTSDVLDYKAVRKMVPESFILNDSNIPEKQEFYTFDLSIRTENSCYDFRNCIEEDRLARKANMVLVTSLMVKKDILKEKI